MTVKKFEVEIQEKPKTAEQEALDQLLEQLNKKVEPPPITDTVEKVKQALAQAKKARTKVRKTWHCTECGGAHIQLYLDGGDSGHFSVDLLDNEPVDANTDEPISGRDKRNMDLARSKSGK